MYACACEIERRFFEGVCPPSNASAHLCDPPPIDSRISTMVDTPWLPSGVRVYAESFRRIYGNISSATLGDSR